MFYGTKVIHLIFLTIHHMLRIGMGFFSNTIFSKIIKPGLVFFLRCNAHTNSASVDEKDLTAATGITYFEKICVRKYIIFSFIQ